MFDKLRQAHLHPHNWQQESLTFVPLRGAWFAQSEHSFDLEEEITKFLSSDKKILLLLGDSGSGKSLYTQGLASKLWADHKPDSPIPVWISLPSLKNPVSTAIEETFEKFGFSAEQILSIKQTHTYIFIFDAFDEIHQLKNLWVSNHLDQWKTKIIITCRREYLYHVDNYKLYFIPFHGEKAVYQDYDEMIIKPFSEEQIEQYIKQYIQHQKPEWSLEQYQKALDEIPGLKNLIKTPFLLKLAMEALPKMPQEKEQKYMTQAKLYDVFIEQWFIRQEQKLKLAKKIKEDEDIKPEFWDYAKRLAQLMHQQKTTLVSYDSSQASDLFGEAEGNPWQRFFNPDNPRIELLRTACLVREVGHHQYSFIHNSLLEYFLTRDLYEKLLSKHQEVKVIQEALKSPQLEEKKPQDYFNERLLVEESNTLRFLADRVDEDEAFKKILFDRVYASRKNPQASIAGSNAVTILNFAKVSFSGMDLSQVQIPFADLSEGIFDHTNFSFANLTSVNLSRAWLRATILDGCQLNQIEFGQLPYLAHKKKVVGFAVSPNQELLATIMGEDPDVYIWDWKNSQLLYALKGGRLTSDANSKSQSSIQFSPNGRLLAVGGSTRFISVWDVANKEMYEFEEITGHAGEVKFSPDSKVLAVASEGLQLYDVKNKKKLHSCRESYEQTSAFEFTSDGKFILAGCFDTKIRLWDVISGECIKIYSGHKKGIKKICIDYKNTFASLSLDGAISLGTMHHTDPLFFFHPVKKEYSTIQFLNNEEKLIAIEGAGNVTIFELKYKQVIFSFNTHDSILAVRQHPNKSILGTGCQGGTVKLWDLNTGENLAVYGDHSDDVWNIGFINDGNFLTSASFDKTVRLWNINIHKRENFLRQNHLYGIICIQISKANKIFASSDYAGNIILSKITTGNYVATLKGHLQLVISMTFSPNEKFLLTCDTRGHTLSTTRLWDLQTFQCIKMFEHPEGRAIFNGVHFISDTELIFVSGFNIYVWSIKENKIIATLEGHEDRITNSRIYMKNENALLLATSSFDKTIRVWNINSKKCIQILRGHKEKIFGIDFSPDGKRLVSGGYDGEVRLWEIASGDCLKELLGHISTILCLEFSSDNIHIASGDLDGRVRIWNTSTGQSSVVKENLEKVHCLEFSPDNNLLACAGENKAVILYNMESQKIVFTLGGFTNSIHQVRFISSDFLIACSADKSIKCWRKIMIREDSHYWQLQWCNSNTSILYTESIRILDTNLSSSDKILLMQHGSEMQLSPIQEKQEKHAKSIQLNKEGVSSYKLKDYFKAISFFKEALSVAEQVHGENHSEIAAICYNIAVSYKDERAVSSAIEYYERVISIDKRLYTEPNILYAKHLISLGLMYQKKGDEDNQGWKDEPYNGYDHFKAVTVYQSALAVIRICREAHDLRISEIEENIEYCISCQNAGEEKNRKLSCV